MENNVTKTVDINETTLAFNSNNLNEEKNFNNNNNKMTNVFKRQFITWGKEIPQVMTTMANYIMTMGSNPLITIKPINIKDSSLVDSSHGHRIFDLENLRNYYKLNEPELVDSPSHNRFRYEYFLSLLDPAMPRLTGCGNYYRMRYAVYVLLKNQATQSTNWRNCPQESINQKVVHIGEIHLYTIIPGYRKGRAINLDSKVSYIHYENISFFLNQSPLNNEEMRVLQANDFNYIGNQFRRFLKFLNSIIVPSQIDDFNSTYLLEQLKYPKTSDHFLHTDGLYEQFIRNQTVMLTRYLMEPQINIEKDEIKEHNETISSILSFNNDEITSDIFVQNLMRLQKTSN